MELRFLTAEQRESFHREGYLVIEGFWSPETVLKLRSKIKKILNDLAPAESAVETIFTTKEQIRQSDNYFLESGDCIRFFWEEKARDANNNFVQAPEDCVNKVGHALHDLDPDFQEVSYEKRVGMICRDLGLLMPLAVQSMYIFKQAHIGGGVDAHQDGAFLYTEPQSVLGFWWALNDCTVDNGCLWAVPKSHELGMHRRFKRKSPPNEGTEWLPAEQTTAWDLSGAIPLEVSAGSLVLIHHSLVHYSAPNNSDNARHAYSIHVIDGIHNYPADNWLRKNNGPFNTIQF